MGDYGAGSEIGRWTVLSELGAGTFGSVLKVVSGNEFGAMKVCHHKQDSAFARLKVETDCLPSFDHVGVPKLLDQNFESDEPYFVMTLATGSTLAQLVRSGNSKGSVLGQIEASEILVSLLSAVEHIHQRGYVHRDIKDANVIVDVDSATASLVDYGFCKRDGLSDMRDPDSFWRAGAGRFSPPSKLLDPTRAVKKQDLFAVGVTAYLLLTGQYPWSASRTEGVASLREQMQLTPLVEVHLVNSRVGLAFSRFISKLLTIDDLRRPTSSEAYEEAVRLADRLKRMPTPHRPRRPAPVYPHVVRDQIHGDVRLTDTEYKVLNTREMQRLRTVKQLGLTHLVYPGAEHTRLAHSIGCLNMAEVMLRAIEDKTGSRFDPDVREQVRLYALTHDYGHVAGGHTVEDQLGLYPRHDKNQLRFERLIGGENSDLGKVLRMSDNGRQVIELLNPQGEVDRDGIVHQAVSGTIGADVLDYVNRDAINCGLDHRVDSAIFRQLRLYSKDPEQNQLIVSDISGKYGLRPDREFAVESLLLERYALFLKVYTHSAKLAADAVLGKALHAAQIPEDQYECFGDEAVVSLLCAHEDQRISSLGDRLRWRQLPRAVLRSPVFRSSEDRELSVNDERENLKSKGYLSPEGRSALEERIAKQSKFHQDRIFFYCSSQPPGYKRAELASIKPGEVRPSSVPVNKSRAMERRHAFLWEIWVYLADATEDERREVAAAAEEILNLPNLIDEYRRPLLDFGF